MRVHRWCYGKVTPRNGVKSGKEKARWQCEPCSFDIPPESLTCVLCRNKRDQAYKRCEGPLPDGRVSKCSLDRVHPSTAWVHVSCAHYHGEPMFGPPRDGQFRSPIFHLDSKKLKLN